MERQGEQVEISTASGTRNPEKQYDPQENALGLLNSYIDQLQHNEKVIIITMMRITKIGVDNIWLDLLQGDGLEAREHYMKFTKDFFKKFEKDLPGKLKLILKRNAIGEYPEEDFDRMVTNLTGGVPPKMKEGEAKNVINKLVQLHNEPNILRLSDNELNSLDKMLFGFAKSSPEAKKFMDENHQDGMNKIIANNMLAGGMSPSEPINFKKLIGGQKEIAIISQAGKNNITLEKNYAENNPRWDMKQ